MTTRFLDQEQLTLEQVAKLLPQRPHRSTVYRWAYEGVGGRKLKTWKAGGRRVSSREALEEFLAATSGMTPSSGTAPHSAQAEEDARLNELGVK